MTDAKISAAHVSAASYSGERLSRDSIVAAFGETKDVSAQHTQIATWLRDLFEAWDKRNIAPIFLNPQETR